MIQKSESGQIIVFTLFGTIILLVLAGIVVDIGMYLLIQLDAQSNVSTACVVAGEAGMNDTSMYAAFADSLTSNGVPPEAYSPKEGTGANLTRGFEPQGDGTIRTALQYKHPTSFLQIIGFSEYTIVARSRCLERSAGVAPIAVKKSEYDDSIADWNSTEDYSDYEHIILGNGVATPDDKDGGTGSNQYRGAIFPMLWCVDDLTTPDPDPECPEVQAHDPLSQDELPPNEQTQKKLVGDCLVGVNCNSIWELETEDETTPEYEGTRLSAVSGTSVPELCKAFNSIYDIGDRLVVIVYDNVLYDPDFGGYWENVGVLFYAIYEVTDLKPTENNCNAVEARLIDQTAYKSLQDIEGLHSREISWGYNGVIPGFSP